MLLGSKLATPRESSSTVDLQQENVKKPSSLKPLGQEL